MAMDLDAFKTIWAEYDGKLAESLRLNRALLQDAVLARTRSALRPLLAALILELAIDLVAVIALGAFLAANVARVKFLVPGVLLDAYAIASLAAIVAQIALIGGVDYGGPVAEIQRTLETLRIVRLRSVRWILLSAPLAWTPLLIVGLRAIGVDAYAVFGAPFVWSNLAFGAAFLGAGVWLVRRFGARLSASGPLAYVARTIEGGELRRARAAAASLRAFESDAA